ncbi:MAG: hypothetical protein HUU20_18645 [Pirellulales bacterium]|nr:hypothetical protein [Pirellulales bacterium]
MGLDQDIAEFLNAAEAGAGRSKLEPYAELIRGLRQRRWTYGRIAAALRHQFGVTAAPSTVFAFVKVRARRKAGLALPAPVIAPSVPHTSAAPRPRFKIDA